MKVKYIWDSIGEGLEIEPETTVEQLQELHRTMQMVFKVKNELNKNIVEYNNQQFLPIRIDPFMNVREALSYIRQKHGG